MPLLGPATDKMGIDRIRFGGMLRANMRTSFMHPPLGFALFGLRGISDMLCKEGALPAKARSRRSYLGSIPFIALQWVLAAVVIAFPQTVTALFDRPEALDPDQLKFELQAPAPRDDDNSRALETLTRGAQEAASAPR